MTSVEEKVLSLEAVTVLLKDVVLKENVIDPVYEISSGSAKGDGYVSFITKVIVKGKNKVLPLIIKKAPNESKIKYVIRSAFLIEINCYEKIFPALKKFQNERGVKHPFNSVPICYKTVDSENGELLVLENIKEKGFELFDKRQQMDHAHVEMVLRLYGQLHAISFSMKDHDEVRFEELTSNLDNALLHLEQDFYDMFIDGSDKIKLVFNENTEPDVHQYFSTLKDEVMPFFKKVGNYNGEYGVLSHGDCWCNNMMFKYENGNSAPPTDMRLFDFQNGTLLSPAVDVSYFFYVSASQDMLDNLDYYLKVYHDSLRKHMLEMGSDVDKWFPFSALKDEWKLYAKYGLFMSVPIFRAMLRDEDEILDFGDEVDSLKDTFMKSSKYDHLINERYRRLALHFYDNKLV